ncbi:MAG: undecaprenyl/decaprenyl-phosphate alpha-N-acetylglucosaminyl 1-phosphate transferase [Bacteroides sp.]|nr:undecaprenyl/decaprenyl-phosphate alpha-N-acetylglucosaminyl 1-phosphate transferase [Bacteroides sp.]
MHYLFVLTTFVVSVLIASLIIPRILVIATRKKLYDVPDARKVHTKAIPRLGGVSFFPTILFSFCYVFTLRFLFGYDVNEVHITCIIPELLLLVCGMTLLYLTGIADDLVGVRWRQKFVIQIICASFFPLSGLWLNNLYGIFGIYEIPFWLGIPFTIFTVVFITNAINLIDGIDGLASGLSSVSLVVFGLLFLEKQLWAYAMLAFATLGVLVPFFYYNVFGSADKARKIFMGDTGSLTLGFIISFLALKYSMVNEEVMTYTPGAIVIAAGTLIIPAFDVIRVVLVRLRSGKSAFEPDKNHIHHKFLAMGYNVRKAMVTLICIAIAFSVANIVLIRYINGTWVVLMDIVVWCGLNLWWDRKKR